MPAQRKLLLGTALLLLNVLRTHQRAPPLNYTQETIRIAKAAEVNAYLGNYEGHCDNFYQYTCANWRQLHPPSEELPTTKYLDRLDAAFEIKLLGMLDNGEPPNGRINLSMEQFFAYCKDLKAIRQHGFKRIFDQVNLEGGWPNITSEIWYESEYDWLGVIAHLRRHLGTNIFIGVNIVPDLDNEDRYRIILEGPKLGLDKKEKYLDADECAEYKQSIEDKLSAYFPYQPTLWVEEVAQQVIDLEQKLAKALPVQNPKRRPKERAIAELKANFGNFVNLERYLSIVFNSTIYVPVYDDTQDYLPALVDIVKTVPKLTIANYTMWRVLNEFDLEAFRHEEIDADVRGMDCMRKIIEYLPKKVDEIFYKLHYDIEHQFYEVFKSLKQTFTEDLVNSTKLDWLSKESRGRAVSKLNSLKLEFDVPFESSDMKDLKSYGDEYIRHCIWMMEWKNRKELDKLIQKPQPELPAPRYDNRSNIIYLPVKYLTPYVLWGPQYPSHIKYATIGTILAREMVRGFYDLESEYSDDYSQSYGGRYSYSWTKLWDETSRNALTERYKCFIDQYKVHSKYQGKPVAAEGLLATAIEDNAAVRLAYRAFEPILKREIAVRGGREYYYPLHGYTDESLFFLIYGHMNCASYHESVDTFNELPEEWRVNLALSNYEEFSKHYDCAAGTQMNPTNKCELF